MQAMSDAECARFIKRVALFRRRGWPEVEAEQWAERLLQRDRDLDERRICQECSELQQDGVCFPARQGWMRGVSKRLEPVRDVLQRCGWFRWAKPPSSSGG